MKHIMKTFLPFLFLLLLFACQDEDPKTPVGPPDSIPFYCNVDIYLDIEDAEGRNLVTMFSDSLDREYVRAEGLGFWQSETWGNDTIYYDKFKIAENAEGRPAYVHLQHVLSGDAHMEVGEKGTSTFRIQLPVFFGREDELEIACDWEVVDRDDDMEYRRYLKYNQLRVNGERVEGEGYFEIAPAVITLQSPGLVDEEMW